MRFEDYEHLRFERHDDGVLLVVINRPEVKNRINSALHTELEGVWGDIGRDSETRVVVLTGEGRMFSSGADFSERRPPESQHDAGRAQATIERMRNFIYAMIDLDKPIISAVRGRAFGGGLSIALTADLSIVAEDAQLAEKHLRTGLVAGDHAVLIWPLLIGMAKAKYLLYTDATISGTEAERLGLVSLAVPDAEVLPTALRIAGELARGPQMALRFTKRALNGWYRQAMPMFEHSIALEVITQLHPNMGEAVTSFIEKRDATFDAT